MTSRYEKKRIKEGYSYIIGCDEVGRGSLAGPVVAAAVAFAPASLKSKVKSYKEIKDSKLLSPEKREKLSVIIKDNCLAWGIGLVDEKTIDKINIHRATLVAMKLAVENFMTSFPGVILRTSASEAEESQTGKRSFARDEKSDERAQSLPREERGDDAAKRVLVAIDGKFIIPSFAEATEGKPNFNNIEQEAIIDGDNKILSIAAASIIAKVYRDNLMRKLHQQYPIYNFKQHKGYGTLFHRAAILQNGLSPIHRKSFCEHLTA